MLDFIKKHSFIIIITAMLDLFGGFIYMAYTSLFDKPVSAVDIWVFAAVIIDIISITIVSSLHKEWFFNDEEEQ